MVNRGPLIVFAAVVFLAGGLFALYLPVFIDAYDQFGWQVKCGNGFTTELNQASSAVGPAGTNYVDQCGNALMVRRLWAIPTAVLGGMALTWRAAAVLAHDHRRPAPSRSAAQSPS
ncbi:hypothetical protein A5760_04360 [Mycobacterium colombiense]|uniref:Transmembrane protein n=1 Tax=Mycobacterium colombiense TaxID=339268 RepID=A0A1A0VTS4_9MYCO|nr:hypothetical protein [Mycobacterium colombiense]OBB86628.1 hypothetical protein A5760_04360 [Mycobacterium colombiense]